MSWKFWDKKDDLGLGDTGGSDLTSGFEPAKPAPDLGSPSFTPPASPQFPTTPPSTPSSFGSGAALTPVDPPKKKMTYTWNLYLHA